MLRIFQAILQMKKPTYRSMQAEKYLQKFFLLNLQYILLGIILIENGYSYI